MRMLKTRICIICLLGILIPGMTQNAAAFSFGISNASGNSKDTRTTNRPWGNLETPKSATIYQPPAPITSSGQYPAMPANGQYPAMPASGQYPAMPASGQYPAMLPSGQYPAMMTPNGWYASQVPGLGNQLSASQPYVEIELGERLIYEQQNVVYTVRVVSTDNLKTLNPVIPRLDGVALEQLDGPVTGTRNTGAGGGREIVNEYHFQLTPLRSGEITVPAIRFEGTHVAGRQWQGVQGMPGGSAESSFAIAADEPLELRALPADPAVAPWLPLHDLRLQAQVPEKGQLRAGEPVTVTLELTAIGARGDRLPSLEGQLTSGDFRAYRDSVTLSNGISKDGELLLGSRKETYTLIPLKDGWLTLPDIQVAWWNVDTATAMVAGLAGQSSLASIRQQLSSIVTGGEQELFSGLFWAPLLILLGVIAGYWLASWARTRPLLHAAGNRARSAVLNAGRGALRYTAAAGRKFSPAPYLDKVRPALAIFMPRRLRVWMCMRCLEREDRPEAWCNEFRNRVCSHLDMARHAPMSAVVEKLIELQPGAEPARLRALGQSMDSAIYGHRALDFAAWKQDFRNQLRPRLYQRRRTRRRTSRSVLPALNPRRA